MTSPNVIGVCKLGSLFSHVLQSLKKLSSVRPRGLPAEGTAGDQPDNVVECPQDDIISYLHVSRLPDRCYD